MAPPPPNLADAVLTDHARRRIAQRDIDEPTIRRVLAAPAAVNLVREGRVVAQAVVEAYLIRVFVDIDREPFEIVTAYRTSKIDKYGAQP